MGKVYGKLEPGLADGVVTEAKYVKGGYIVVQTIEERDNLAAAKKNVLVVGSAVYVCNPGSENQPAGLYRYQGIISNTPSWAYESASSSGSGNSSGSALNNLRDAEHGALEQTDTKYTGDSIVFNRVPLGDGTTTSLKGTQRGRTVPGAVATGFNAVALGGLRFNSYVPAGSDEFNFNKNKKSDFVENFGCTQTEASGAQSLAVGGSTHAYGDWSVAFNKDTNSYQRGSAALGGSTQAGMTAEEFGVYWWDATKKIPLHGGKGLVDGKPMDDEWCEYEYSNSFAVAIGEQTKALGRSSLAAGVGSEASGPFSIAAGRLCEATKSTAVALGYLAKAYGESSYAFGQECTVNSNLSFAAGYKCTVNDIHGIAMGNQVTISGNGGVGLGTQNTVHNGVTLGRRNNVQGPLAVAIGADNAINTAYTCAVLLGQYLTASANRQVVVGYNNKNDADAAFIVGNGDKLVNNAYPRSNAFVVMSDGRAKAYSAAVEDEDLVRNKEFKESAAKDVRGVIIEKDGKKYLQLTTHSISDSITNNFVDLSLLNSEDSTIELTENVTALTSTVDSLRTYVDNDMIDNFMTGKAISNIGAEYTVVNGSTLKISLPFYISASNLNVSCYNGTYTANVSFDSGNGDIYDYMAVFEGLTTLSIFSRINVDLLDDGSLANYIAGKIAVAVSREYVANIESRLDDLGFKGPYAIYADAYEGSKNWGNIEIGRVGQLGRTVYGYLRNGNDIPALNGENCNTLKNITIRDKNGKKQSLPGPASPLEIMWYDAKDSHYQTIGFSNVNRMLHIESGESTNHNGNDDVPNHWTYFNYSTVSAFDLGGPLA